MLKIIKGLEKALRKSWLASGDFNSASAAITKSSVYYSGYFESKTHLFDISSEQGAIALAVSNKDPKIRKVITLVNGEFKLSPLVLKFFIDHIKRTGVNFSYEVASGSGETLFFSQNVRELLPFYSSETEFLKKTIKWKPRENKVLYNPLESIYEQLKWAAENGMETHFTMVNKGSLYGASVLAEDKIYFGGVYSSPDQRLGLHAEMVAVLSAIMGGSRKISMVALMSDKFTETPPQACGICRQLLMEIQQKTKNPIKVVCFSQKEKERFEIDLGNYLPYPWNI